MSNLQYKNIMHIYGQPYIPDSHCLASGGPPYSLKTRDLNSNDDTIFGLKQCNVFVRMMEIFSTS